MVCPKSVTGPVFASTYSKTPLELKVSRRRFPGPIVKSQLAAAPPEQRTAPTTWSGIAPGVFSHELPECSDWIFQLPQAFCEFPELTSREATAVAFAFSYGKTSPSA